MTLPGRIARRILLWSVTLLLLWLIVTQVFDRLEHRLPLFVALIATYAVSAYLLLPQLIHAWMVVFRRGRIPRVTHSGDGLPADPVNIILTGTADDLAAAFAAIGWHRADGLSIGSSWRMITSFVFSTPYPTAPFSSLFLFGRKQDVGFQQPIGNSPRKRNHVRFWAASEDAQAEIADAKYWMRKHPMATAESRAWVGAGTRDVGLGLTSHTYQISHRVDRDVDAEREHILDSLTRAGWAHDERFLETTTRAEGGFVSDGRIRCASLAPPGDA